MSQKRILIAFAHPDDESFGLGALIGKYVAEGVQVDLICATNGDVGTIDPHHLDGYESHAALRLAELDCARRVLGLSHVATFGYKDSGMMGSAENDDPDCLWYAWQHMPGVVTRRVVEVIRERRPQVIITFNRYGGYGHPDHIAIQRATVAAFAHAGDPAYVTPGLAPYSPQKLYYNNIPAFFIRYGVWQARLQRKDPRKMGRNQDIDMLAILENVEPSHTHVDVGDYVPVWDAASACHASQGGGLRGRGLLRLLQRITGVRQGFTRVVPVPDGKRTKERDLFEGINLEEQVTEHA